MLDPLLIPLAKASADCYATDVVYSWENINKTAHLLHTVVNNTNTFAFCGTLPKVDEWEVDFFAIPISVEDHPQMGDVHAGFLLDAQVAVVEYIAPKLESLGWPPFYLTGHSKGAGEAPLAAGELKAIGHQPIAIRLYEPPMCGGAALLTYLSDIDILWTQTYNNDGVDIVTLVPFGESWKHNGSLLQLKVPDSYDIPTKHRIPAVQAALVALT